MTEEETLYSRNNVSRTDVNRRVNTGIKIQESKQHTPSFSISTVFPRTKELHLQISYVSLLMETEVS